MIKGAVYSEQGQKEKQVSHNASLSERKKILKKESLCVVTYSSGK